MTNDATTRAFISSDVKQTRTVMPGELWVHPSPLTTPVAGKTVIGRATSCQTVLSEEEISRRHAELWLDRQGIVIRDLNSENGVHVNGLRRAEASLRPGDVLRLGPRVGVVVSDIHEAGFREIASGWFGGAALAAAVKQVRSPKPELPILIQGETGTGKEGAARAIHVWSKRPGPFIAVNCACVPTTLSEDNYFGHAKGAFEGAEEAAKGYFEQAHRGTIYLDELPDMPLPVQAKLLRILEDRVVMPLGPRARPIPVDLLVVTSCQESLEHAVEKGLFRRDLYARLHGEKVVLPPLRERREDIMGLFRRVIEEHAGNDAPAVDALLAEQLCVYDWPDNVRQLVHLARLLVSRHGDSAVLCRSHIPPGFFRESEQPQNGGRWASSPPEDPSSRASGRRVPVDDPDDRERLLQALAEYGGNVSSAARAIGVSRSRANRILERNRLDRAELKGGHQR